MTIDTFGSTFDTVLAVYTGQSVDALTPVAGNNDSGGKQSKVTFTATKGTHYAIAVDGVSGVEGTVSLQWIQVPPNDDMAGAIEMPGSNGTLTGTNVAASKQPSEPDHAGNPGGKSVWWQWTAPTTGVVILDTFGSDFDTLLAVYTGTSVTDLTLVAGDDNGGGGVHSRLRLQATAGVVYRIAIDGYNGDDGYSVLSWVQAPPNDGFDAAPVLTGNNGTVNGTNVAATKETGEFNHAFNPGGHSVWYRWTAPGDGLATINTFSSDFDTTLAVYTGPTVNALQLVAANADVNMLGTSQVDFTATKGVVYRIAVDGHNGASGSIKLHWESPPENDNFNSATVLGGVQGSTTGTNLGATKEPGEPNHASVIGGASVWYTWTAPSTGPITFDTVGSDFDTLVGVYTGASVGGLTKVASGSNPAVVPVKVNAKKGVVYRIAVDGPNGSGGLIKLNRKAGPPTKLSLGP